MARRFVTKPKSVLFSVSPDAGGVVVGEAAGAAVKVMSLRDLVDFAVEWFVANRG